VQPFSSRSMKRLVLASVLSAAALTASCKRKGALPAGEATKGPTAALDAAADALAVAPKPTVKPKPETEPAWGSLPQGEGPLYALVDGMCVNGALDTLDGATVFRYGTRDYNEGRGGAVTAAIVEDAGIPVTEGYGLGRVLGTSATGVTTAKFIGTFPDRMMVVVSEADPAFGGNRGEVRFGSATSLDWKVALGAQGPSGPGYFSQPFRYGDLWVFAQLMSMGSNERLVALDLEGNYVAKPKVPGPDIARDSKAGMLVVHPTTREVLAMHHSDPLVIRWSPSKPVKDLKLPGKSAWETERKIQASNRRVVIQLGGALFEYVDGDEVKPIAALARFTSKDSWVLGSNDKLYVALASGTLLTEDGQGNVTEAAFPKGGIFAGYRVGDQAQAGQVWAIVRGQNEQSDELHRSREAGWERVPLPTPPFATPASKRLQIDDVVIVNKDDVFVLASHEEKGWSWKSSVRYQVVYRTKKPTEVLRCQDTRTETGAGFWSWPRTLNSQASDPACKNVFVVLSKEPPDKLPTKYPQLTQALAKHPELGATIKMVNFQERGQINLGVVATDLAQAEALAHLLGKKTSLQPEVVCGAPDATRTLSLDTTTGAVSVVP
jgi:hypothetical protein